MFRLYPLIVAGPSGVGKSYLAKHLTEHYLCQRVTPTTTRPPRLNEVDGVDYHFVSHEEYLKRIREGDMFMSSEFFGALYGFESDSVYGILRSGLVPVTEIYTPRVGEFIKAYPSSRALFLTPESEELLKWRMVLRGDSEEQVEYRLNTGREEVKLYRFEGYQRYYSSEHYVGTHNFPQMVEEIARDHDLTLRPVGERLL